MATGQALAEQSATLVPPGQAASPPQASRPGQAASPPQASPRRSGTRFAADWPVWWPLSVVILGYPLWWLLGIAPAVVVAMSVPMLAELRKRRPVVLPSGFGWWSMFIVWVMLGVFVLWTDAPGAVPGGGLGRLGVFVYSLLMYLTCTVALVWVANLSGRGEFPFAKLARTLSWLYVIVTVGGLAGLLLPDLQLRSLMEMVLPGSLSSNSFVSSLIHPQLADIQDVLGRPEARPTAPFAYSNTWGSVVALSLPFFLVSWFADGSRGRRFAGAVVLLASSVPIVFSLNRGLWICLAVGAAYLVVVQARRGHLGALIAALLALVAAALVFWASPLGDIVSERLEHQHSNDRRGELLVQTVVSSATGSPVIGFGGTRDVQGSFASIAGGSTADCPACGVPPLGTQGHLWLAVFAQGLVGASFFLMFFLAALWRTWRGHSRPERVGFIVVLFFAIQLVIYDTLGVPLLVVMLAIGAAWGASVRDPVTGVYATSTTTVRGALDELRANLALIAVLGLVGGLAGVATALLRDREYEAKEYILLAASPSYVDTESDTDQSSAAETTIDTEAALVVSQQTLSQVDPSIEGQADLRERLEITAVTNTRVLVIALRSSEPEGLSETLGRISDAYLVTREEFLVNRRDQLLAILAERTRELDELGLGAGSEERTAIDQATNDVLLTPTTPGEEVRVSEAAPVRRQLPRAGATGLACGLAVAGAVVGLRRRGARR